MAIARDATSSGNATTTALVVSHTCTGTNLKLRVHVYVAAGAGTGDRVTSVTYIKGGSTTNLTRLVALDYNATNGNYVYIYEMSAPDTGTHNITVNLSASSDVTAFGSSYTGCDPTATTGNEIKSFTSTSANACTMNPVTITDGSWATSMIRNLDGTPTDGTNCIQFSGSSSIEGADSNASTGVSGTITVEMTKTSSRWVTATAALAPKVTSFSKNLSETLTLTDTLTKKPTIPFAETLTLTDTLTKLKLKFKTFTETLTLTDTLKKFAKKVMTETLTLTDSFSRLRTKSFTEAISLVDTLTIQVNGFLKTAWVKVLKPVGDLWTKITKPNT